MRSTSVCRPTEPEERPPATLGRRSTTSALHAIRPTDTQIRIIWDLVPGASAYKIYRATTAGAYGATSVAGIVPNPSNGPSSNFFDSGATLTSGTLPTISSVGTTSVVKPVVLTGNYNFSDVILRNNRFYLPPATFTSSLVSKELGHEVAPDLMGATSCTMKCLRCRWSRRLPVANRRVQDDARDPLVDRIRKEPGHDVFACQAGAVLDKLTQHGCKGAGSGDQDVVEALPAERADEARKTRPTCAKSTTRIA